MLAVTALKFIALSFVSIILCSTATGTGALFAGYTISAARNPEEAENLFNTSLTAFALIEAFVSLTTVIATIIYFLSMSVKIDKPK